MTEAVAAFLPLALFILVFTFCYLVFSKTELLSDKTLLNLLISFLLSGIFITTTSDLSVITGIVPIFAILIVGLVLILALAGFVELGEDFYKKVGIGFATVLIIVFALLSFGFFLIVGKNFFSTTSAYPPIVTNSLLFAGILGGLGWAFLRKSY